MRIGIATPLPDRSGEPELPAAEAGGDGAQPCGEARRGAGGAFRESGIATQAVRFASAGGAGADAGISPPASQPIGAGNHAPDAASRRGKGKRDERTLGCCGTVSGENRRARFAAENRSDDIAGDARAFAQRAAGGDRWAARVARGSALRRDGCRSTEAGGAATV